jgi:hypothetical protein
MSALICTLIFLTIAAQAMAHGDDDHAATLSWTFDPWIVLPIVLISLLYVAGRIRLSRRTRRSGAMRWQDLFFCGGMLTLAGALVSPLHWLGEHLFTFHMIEHEIVIAVSAPLISLRARWAFSCGDCQGERAGRLAPLWRFLPFAGHGTGVPAAAARRSFTARPSGDGTCLSFSTPRSQAPPCIAFNT